MERRDIRDQKEKIPKIKICGITSETEAQWLVEEQVEYVGMVLFFEKSKRNISLQQAEKILQVIRQGKTPTGQPMQAVAVTVSPAISQVKQMEAAGFDWIQIHGTLEEETLRAITLPVIRAYNGIEQEAMETAAYGDSIQARLFDAGKPGSGKTFDWRSLRQTKRDDKPLFLAGGLYSGNVAEAIREVKPDVVDVSSGVEIAPDRVGKDREKIRIFVEQVRNRTYR